MSLVADWARGVLPQASRADLQLLESAGFAGPPAKSEYLRESVLAYIGPLLEIRSRALAGRSESLDSLRRAQLGVLDYDPEKARRLALSVVDKPHLHTKACATVALEAAIFMTQEFYRRWTFERTGYRRSWAYVPLMGIVTFVGAVAGVPLLVLSAGLAAGGQFEIAIPAALFGWLSFALWAKSLYGTLHGELDAQLRAADAWSVVAPEMGLGVGLEHRLRRAEALGASVAVVLWDLCAILSRESMLKRSD